MAEYTLFTNPMSRAQIGRWTLHEAGADYEQVLVDWQNKPAALLAANPLGKVPTVIHHAPGGDRVITECAAICAYLAAGELAPTEAERADYYRWMFFAAAPLEQGILARQFGFEPQDIRQRMMAGFGDVDLMIDMLANHLAERDWVCGRRFTMADVYVGSQVDWGLQFGTFPKHPALEAYAERLRAREAYRAAKAIDAALIAAMQDKE